jgi:hypothetical protein
MVARQVFFRVEGAVISDLAYCVLFLGLITTTTAGKKKWETAVVASRLWLQYSSSNPDVQGAMRNNYGFAVMQFRLVGQRNSVRTAAGETGNENG